MYLASEVAIIHMPSEHSVYILSAITAKDVQVIQSYRCEFQNWKNKNVSAIERHVAWRNIQVV